MNVWDQSAARLGPNVNHRPRWATIGGILSVLLILGADAVAAPNTVTAKMTPSRTVGQAPLLVFFDATTSTDSDTSKPIHHLTYCFDAGDGNTGVYSLAGHKTTKKAQFCGSPLFAYVYEVPGTYTAKVTATAADGDVHTTTATITVQAYNAVDTTCVSTSGNFSGCPSGAARVTNSDFDNQATADLRVLFRCGENFSVSTTVSLTNGRHIGGFDSNGVVTNRRCRYNVTSGQPNPLFNITGDDVRVTDGTWTGVNGSHFFTGVANSTADTDNLLISNWNLTTIRSMTVLAANSQGGSALPKYIGFFGVNAQDCGNSGDNCIFSAIEGFALVDSIFADSSNGEHVLRLQHGEDTFIHNVKLEEPADLKGLITARALDWAGGIGGIANRWSENVFVSDSWFVGKTAYSVSDCGKNDPAYTSHCRNHIYERNYATLDSSCYPSQGCSVMFHISQGGGIVQNYTYRNNLCDMTHSESYAQCFKGAISSGAELYNNSMYSDAHSRSFYTDAQNCTAKNNLAWDNTGSQKFYQSTTCATSLNNRDANGSENGVASLTQCPYVNCPPTSPADFAIKGTDPDALVDGGVPVPSNCNFFGSDRAQGLAVDVGAFEQGTSSFVCSAASTGVLNLPLNARISNVVP